MSFCYPSPPAYELWPLLVTGRLITYETQSTRGSISILPIELSLLPVTRYPPRRLRTIIWIARDDPTKSPESPRRRKTQQKHLHRSHMLFYRRERTILYLCRKKISSLPSVRPVGLGGSTFDSLDCFIFRLFLVNMVAECYAVSKMIFVLCLLLFST